MDTPKREPDPQYYPSTEVSQDQRAKDLNWAIGLNQKVLKILGLWSYAEQSQWQTIRFNLQTMFFSVGILISNTIPQTLALIKVWGSISLMVDNLIENFPIAFCQFKIIIPWFYKKVLANIFKEIERDWLLSRSQQERNVMLKYAKISRIMTILGLLSGLINNICFYTPLIYGIVPRTITNLTDKPDSLFSLQAVYFHDTSTRYRYYLTVMSQIVGSVFAAFVYSGTSVLFGMVVLHACGQLEILASRFKTMVNKKSTNFQHLLNMHMKTHYRLIRFVRMIEQLFSLMLLAVFGCNAITFCILGYQLITVSGDSTVHVPVSHTIFYTQFLSYFLFAMFIYSWVGENLITQSEAIYTEIYNCDWYILKPREAAEIILLLIGSQNPLQITAGKLFPVTLRTFLSLLKTSAGYISCLLAVKD